MKHDRMHHRAEDRCYWCATDEELALAMDGKLDRLVQFDVPEYYCPMMTEV